MMKQGIIATLKAKHAAFNSYLSGLNEEEFEYQRNGIKWSAGQEALHIVKSVKALIRAMSLPKVAMKLTFGKANRPSRTYGEVVAKYQSKLEEGKVVTTSQFEPDPVVVADRPVLLEKLTEKVDALGVLLDKYSENELDEYILPHPLLGKMTLREMAYFTMYHVEHHFDNSRRNLGK